MVKKAMGIDPSATSTGVCVVSSKESDPDLKGDLVWVEAPIQIKEYRGMERAIRQVNKLDEMLVSLKPDVVVFEGYAYGNKHSLVTLVEVGTCLRLAVRRRNIPYLVISPMQLKKFCGASKLKGKGSAKAKVARGVKKFWGYEHDCDDVVDAFVLAQMGLLALGQKPDDWETWQLAMRAAILSTKP